MNMTGTQAEALADYLVTIRPDWTKRYVVDALRVAYGISPDVERLTRVAVRAALTAKIVKPDVIGMRGEHWKAQADYEPEPPRPGGRCERCAGLHAADSPCDAPVADHRPHIAAMRAQAWAARHHEKEATA